MFFTLLQKNLAKFSVLITQKRIYPLSFSLFDFISKSIQFYFTFWMLYIQMKPFILLLFFLPSTLSFIDVFSDLNYGKFNSRNYTESYSHNYFVDYHISGQKDYVVVLSIQNFNLTQQSYESLEVYHTFEVQYKMREVKVGM